MLSETIRKKLTDKLGLKYVTSRDCAFIGGAIGVSETTAKRMFGLVADEESRRTQYGSTMERVARFLGYESYRDLQKEIGEQNFSSKFKTFQQIEASNLKEGSQVQFAYEPGRFVVITYIGDGEFIVNESRNSKLQKGDRIRLSHLVLGHELLVSEVVRDGISLGAYQTAQDGGLTLLELIV